MGFRVTTNKKDTFMNTYCRDALNVFLVKCPEKHKKGDIIEVTTKYGKYNDIIIDHVIVYNLISQGRGFFYYSAFRVSGLELLERAKAKANEGQEEKAKFWASREDDIGLSTPESLEFYKYKLEEAEKFHADMKSGKIPRAHMHALEYAKKDVNKFKNLYGLATILWG
jgi:hypothetical protein